MESRAELRQDYVRTAWAKGLRERMVVVRHALKNGFIPVVTLIGLQLPILVGGSVIILVFVLVSIFAIFKLRDGLLVDSSMLLWQ